VTRNELSVDERARSLAQAVFKPPLRLPSDAGFPLRAITAGLLPVRLREAYRLPWGRPQRAAFALARGGLRRVGPLVPRQLRDVPQARIAERRIRSSKEIGHGG
jgi:uncharacterized protein (DUF2236 family)